MTPTGTWRRLVLRETARRMRDAVRPTISIGRYGGEEFLLVPSNCDAIGAVALAERLLQAVRKDTIVWLKTRCL